MNKYKGLKILLFLVFYNTISEAQIYDFKQIDFAKADSIASLYPDHSLADIKLLSDKLTTSLSTDDEKFRAIYKWVCDNIENDYGDYKRNKYKREKLLDKPAELKEWERKFSARSFQKLLKKHRTVCTGYAYLIRELSYFADIPCEIIHGYGRNAESNIGGAGIPNHSWNAVQLNGQWYLCDPTWSSGAIDKQAGGFVKHFNEEYFLADPSLFVLNHYPLDTTWILMKDRPSLERFLNAPLIYKSAFRYEAIPLFPEKFEITVTKGESVSFQFSAGHLLNALDLKVVIVVGNDHFLAENETKGLGQNKYLWNHTFNRKGQYIVHFIKDEEYLFTYTVNVSN